MILVVTKIFLIRKSLGNDQIYLKTECIAFGEIAHPIRKKIMGTMKEPFSYIILYIPLILKVTHKQGTSTLSDPTDQLQHHFYGV